MRWRTGHPAIDPALPGHGPQHFLDRRAQRQVGARDDACAQARSRASGVAVRDPCDERCFTDAAQRLGPVRAVVGQALDVHGGRQLVPASGIGQVVRSQVAVSAAVPQVVVRVDDLPRRLPRRLLALCQPALPLLQAPLGVWRGFTHNIRPPSTAMVCP